MKERKIEDTPRKEFPSQNTPHYDTPVGDPPVPNRAFTEMQLQNGIDVMNEEEKARMFTNRNS